MDPWKLVDSPTGVPGFLGEESAFLCLAEVEIRSMTRKVVERWRAGEFEWGSWTLRDVPGTLRAPS